jgi:hypothetical protein
VDLIPPLGLDTIAIIAIIATIVIIAIIATIVITTTKRKQRHHSIHRPCTNTTTHWGKHTCNSWHDPLSVD